MRILYLVHQFYPESYTGTEKALLNVALMMQKLGHQVKVVTYALDDRTGFDEEIDGVKLRHLTVQGVPVTAVKYTPHPSGFEGDLLDSRVLETAHVVMEREHPDLIHVYHPMRMSEILWQAKALEVPYLLTLTDFWLMCPKGILIDSSADVCMGPGGGEVCPVRCPELPASFVHTRLRHAEDLLFDADRVASPSEFLANFFHTEFPGLSVKVIPHGLRYSTIEKSFGRYTDDAALTIGYAGALAWHKGVHVLLEAFRNTTTDRMRLKIYGSGNATYEHQLYDMAQGDSRIEFMGVYSADELKDVYAGLDVVVIPSLWYENYPLVLHEALASEVPAIVSDIGALAQKIQDGETGFRFKRGDAADLQAVLEKLAESPSVLNTFKHNLQSHMVPTVEQETYAYLREYERVLEQRVNR
ncbi:glycosyltransferase [Alicyclobacillus tolerans]|uniref:glycosyltransferase n=1 Tax=Alicyclobacillus tolerans TaxID=90970 RepID=UPI001F1867C3|nr:glycosyltransferase [Alicyclobacillus tolerans]MCF8563265.1 glycosyltransferase [Alicyclobacillus tolerans]